MVETGSRVPTPCLGRGCAGLWVEELHVGGVEPQFGLLAFAERGLGVECDDELGAHRFAVDLVGELAEDAADLRGALNGT